MIIYNINILFNKIIKQIKLINKQEFAKTVLNINFEIFVIYIKILKVSKSTILNFFFEQLKYKLQFYNKIKSLSRFP